MGDSSYCWNPCLEGIWGNQKSSLSPQVLQIIKRNMFLKSITSHINRNRLDDTFESRTNIDFLLLLGDFLHIISTLHILPSRMLQPFQQLLDRLQSSPTLRKPLLLTLRIGLASLEVDLQLLLPVLRQGGFRASCGLAGGDLKLCAGDVDGLVGRLVAGVWGSVLAANVVAKFLRGDGKVS